MASTSPNFRAIVIAMKILITLISLAAFNASALEYEKDIMPIFVKKCGECHSNESGKAKGGLKLDDPAHFHGRFAKNSLVVPGDWDASYLFITLYRPEGHEDAMPPEGKGERLSSEEVKLVQQWITDGAPVNGERGEKGKMPPETESADEMKPAPNPVEQEWTNTDGKTILATLLRVEGDVALLRLKNGTVYKYPITKLSEASRAKLDTKAE